MASSKQQPLEKKVKDLSIPKYCRRVLCFDTETTGLLPRHIPGTPFPEDAAYPYITQLSWIMYNVSTGELEEVVDEYISIPANVEISPESTKVSGITREIVDSKGKPLAPLLARFYAAYMKCDSIVAHNMNFDKEVVRQEMRRNKQALIEIIKDRSRVNTMLGIGTKRFNQVYDIELFCTMTNTTELCNIEWVPKETAAGPVEASSIEESSIDKSSMEESTEQAKEPPSTPLEQSEKIPGKKPSNRKKWPSLTELYTKVFETVPPSDLHNSIIDVLVCLRCFLKVRGAMEIQEDAFQTLVAKYSRPSNTTCHCP